MFMVLQSELITLILSQNYDYNISRQLLNRFKTLRTIYIFWSSAALNKVTIIVWAFWNRFGEAWDTSIELLTAQLNTCLEISRIGYMDYNKCKAGRVHLNKSA